MYLIEIGPVRPSVGEVGGEVSVRWAYPDVHVDRPKKLARSGAALSVGGTEVDVPRRQAHTAWDPWNKFSPQSSTSSNDKWWLSENDARREMSWWLTFVLVAGVGLWYWRMGGGGVSWMRGLRCDVGEGGVECVPLFPISLFFVVTPNAYPLPQP
jgi:hypothetical protein